MPIWRRGVKDAKEFSTGFSLAARPSLYSLTQAPDVFIPREAHVGPPAPPLSTSLAEASPPPSITAFRMKPLHSPNRQVSLHPYAGYPLNTSAGHQTYSYSHCIKYLPPQSAHSFEYRLVYMSPLLTTGLYRESARMWLCARRAY